MLQVAGRQRNWIGASTEHLTISRLLEQGHKVAIPAVDDDGVDLVVNYSVRVQVKCSQLHNMQPGAHPYWVFKSPAGWRADVYVLRGIAEGIDRWWVVPHVSLQAAGVRQSIPVHPKGTGKWGELLSSFEDDWGVFCLARFSR